MVFEFSGNPQWHDTFKIYLVFFYFLSFSAISSCFTLPHCSWFLVLCLLLCINFDSIRIVCLMWNKLYRVILSCYSSEVGTEFWERRFQTSQFLVQCVLVTIVYLFVNSCDEEFCTRTEVSDVRILDALCSCDNSVPLREFLWRGVLHEDGGFRRRNSSCTVLLSLKLSAQCSENSDCWIIWNNIGVKT